jgi:hypothetical protein
MTVRAPWRHKNYRPLSFTKGFGWRVTPKGQLALSLGRGRPRLLLDMPDVHDAATGQQETKQERRANHRHRQQLSQWSRGRQESYVEEKTGLKGGHVLEDGSTKTCPMCLTHNRPAGRYYRCKDPECGFTCHRDAVGAVNILQRAVHGDYTPIGAGTQVRVTYLRAVERWSIRQRKAHGNVQRRKTARALSSAQNRALMGEIPSSKLAEAKSSTSSQEPGPLAAVA